MTPGIDIKPIARLLCDAPLFSLPQLALACHVSERYRGPIGPLLSRALPAGLISREAGFLTSGQVAPDVFRVAHERWPAARNVLSALELGAAVTPLDVAAVLPAGEQEACVKALVQAGIARVVPGSSPEVAGSTHGPPPRGRGSRSGGEPRPASDSIDEEAVSAGTLGRATRRALSLIFSDVANRRGSVFLLEGSPPPSELVLQISRRCAGLRRQAVVIVPDVRGIRQLLAALRGRLPDGEVVAFHGRMSAPDRRAAWLSMLHHPPAVVVGAQMAILAPLDDPGAVVVLDEHSDYYKHGRTPRYHTRDLALWLARRHKASAVLVSSVPDPATLWRAQCGMYRHMVLDVPIGAPTGAPPAQHDVDVLDLRHELRLANTSLISRRLHASLATALRRGEQAILLLNRRGTNTQLICARCGYVAYCHRCSVALTFHADDGTLICHYCDARYEPAQTCPNCPDRRLTYVGAGTQKAEQALREHFPSARIERLDRDASQGSATDRATARRFANGDIDVIIGTRLLARNGLLPPANLVAVLNADVTLHLPDYRAAQSTHELLCAVEALVQPGGHLIIQTYSSEHWAIQSIAQRSPALFYREELRQRRALGYPPFAHLARLLRSHASEERCREEAEALAMRLEEARLGLGLTRVSVIGPAPAYVGRLRGKSRWQIFLRGHGFAPLLDLVPRGWTVDVDPISTL